MGMLWPCVSMMQETVNAVKSCTSCIKSNLFIVSLYCSAASYSDASGNAEDLAQYDPGC